MASSSRRKSSRNMDKEKRGRENFVSRVISPAIRRQKCPICLENLSDRKAAVLTVCNHGYCLKCISKWSDLKRNCPLCNAEFDSWFHKINLSSRKFVKQQLPALRKGKKAISRSSSSSRIPQRIIQRTREEFNSARRRTQPLPWRRSFGRGSVPDHVVAERKLQWRASVYNQWLQAVPLSPGHFLEPNVLWNNVVKQRILQRIEPWIRRDLQAILGDPDPCIIIHVASSLFIASLEGRFDPLPGHLGDEDDFLASLRPFLHEQTDMFWHELRCFAESSLTMDAYDAVVEYENLD